MPTAFTACRLVALYHTSGHDSRQSSAQTRRLVNEPRKAGYRKKNGQHGKAAVRQKTHPGVHGRKPRNPGNANTLYIGYASRITTATTTISVNLLRVNQDIVQTRAAALPSPAPTVRSDVGCRHLVCLLSASYRLRMNYSALRSTCPNQLACFSAASTHSCRQVLMPRLCKSSFRHPIHLFFS